MTASDIYVLFTLALLLTAFVIQRPFNREYHLRRRRKDGSPHNL